MMFWVLLGGFTFLFLVWGWEYLDQKRKARRNAEGLKGK